MLYLSELRTGHWFVIALDAHSQDGTFATNREADLLVRAWLSLVPPPTVEQLSDLV